MISALGALAHKLWDLSPWWTALFGAGFVVSTLSAFAMWRTRGDRSKDRVNQNYLRQELRTMGEARTTAIRLLAQPPRTGGVHELLNSRWNDECGRVFDVANSAARDAYMPRDIASLVLMPEKPPERRRDIHSGFEERYYQLAIVRQGLDEAIPRLAARIGVKA